MVRMMGRRGSKDNWANALSMVVPFERSPTVQSQLPSTRDHARTHMLRKPHS